MKGNSSVRPSSSGLSIKAKIRIQKTVETFVFEFYIILFFCWVIFLYFQYHKLYSVCGSRCSLSRSPMWESMFTVGVTNVGCNYSRQHPHIAVTNICHCYNVTTSREAKWRPSLKNAGDVALKRAAF
jgi:hypothetical protein